MPEKDRVPPRFREAYDRLLDRRQAAQRRGTALTTVFYDPETLQYLENLLQKDPTVPWCTLGGLPEAEYRVICFNPEALRDEEPPLAVVAAKPQKGPCQWAHRDVLGAVLGTGLKRERIGDILIHPWGAQIVCLQESAGVLQWQLDSIGRDAVTVELQTLEELVAVAQEEALLTVFVSGLRVDALVAAVWNLSRSEAQDLVRAEKVRVNYKTASSASALADAGDMVSVRGFGRFVVKEIQGATRKDRLRVLISKTL